MPRFARTNHAGEGDGVGNPFILRSRMQNAVPILTTIPVEEFSISTSTVVNLQSSLAAKPQIICKKT